MAKLRAAIQIWFSRLIAFCAVLGAAALLIFGDKPTFHKLPDGRVVHNRVVVSYWENWTGFEGRAMTHVVNAFNMSQNRIFINTVQVSDLDIKALISVAGNDPPDIVTLWSRDMGQYVANDALTPLDVLEKDGVVNRHTFVPYVWRLCTPFHHLYALGATPETCALYWNKNLFRNAGLDPNKPPTTIAELDAMARRLTIFNSNGGIRQIGFLPTIPDWSGWEIMWGIYFGNHLFNPKTGGYQINTPQQRAAYKWYQSFSRRYGYRELEKFQGGFGPFNSSLNPFMSQHVAMEIQGPYFANFIEKNNPEMKGEYGVAPFPTAFGPPGAAVFGDCDVWAIPRGARHVQAALTVLKFFIQQKNIEYLCDKQCKPSPLMKVSGSFIRNNPNPYIRLFERVTKSKNVQLAPMDILWSRVYSELRSCVQRIWAGHSVGRSLAHAQRVVDRWQLNLALLNAQRRREARP